LLKKQGFDVICIGIQFYSKEKEKMIADRYNRHQDFELDPEVREPAPFIGISVIDNLNEVKSICDKIGLTFYAVDASGEYQNLITDKLVAAKIGGMSFSPSVYVTKLIFEILLQKCQKLKADHIASGHYAKVLKNQATKSFNIFVANDVLHDQSKDFCILDQKILSKIILPFSEMRRVEVEKIGKQILGLKFIESVDKNFDLLSHQKMPQFTLERSPEVMIKEGAVLDLRSDTVITDHEGIHNFYYGMNDLKTKSGLPLDKSMAVLDIVYSTGSVVAGVLSDMKVQMVILKDVILQGELDITKPVDIYLKVNNSEDLLRGTVFFNNNSFCYIELEEEYHGLIIKGEYVAFYNKKGVSGRLMGGGEVLKAGLIDNGEFLKLPKYDEFADDEPEVLVDIYKFKL
jgi:tRNA-specific 2-thiouridylase